MGNLNLLDLECILIRKNYFDIELNGIDMTGVSTDWLWEELHNNDIVEAEPFADMIYIKYIKKLEENELIICLE